MELEIKKVKVEDIQIGDEVITSFGKVISIEIREKGKRTFKLEGKNKLTSYEETLIDVIIPKK